jgi:hypothetical protein
MDNSAFNIIDSLKQENAYMRLWISELEMTIIRLRATIKDLKGRS